MIKSDMRFLHEGSWLNMQKEWEKQKVTHQELCGVRKAWDSTCQCELIEQVRESVAREIEAFRDSKILGTMQMIDGVEDEIQRQVMGNINRIAGTAVTSAAAIARGNFHED